MMRHLTEKLQPASSAAIAADEACAIAIGASFETECDLYMVAMPS
jgi:hypothetical protein